MISYHVLPDLKELRMEQKEYERQFYAANSISMRGVQIRWYLDFVRRCGDDQAPFPCSSECVALYTTWLARDLTYRLVVNYHSGLNRFFKLSGVQGINYERDP